MGKELAVAVQYFVSLSAAFLKHEDFVVFEVFENFCLYGSTFHNRCAYLYLTVIIHQQDFVEAHRGVFILFETVYVELPTFLSFKLLACYFYYYVHSV